MNAWTPGPWHYNEGAKNVVNWSEDTSAGLRFPMEINIRLIRGTWSARSSKEAESNARLISLAPEMAEALRALDKAFWPAANGWGDEIQDAIQEAHNLLARLEGGEK